MDYYNILKVNANSTQDEIKKSYRKMSLKHHPDRKGGDSEMFKKINAAYEILSDPQKKKNYDFSLSSKFPSRYNPRSDPLNDWSNEKNIIT